MKKTQLINNIKTLLEEVKNNASNITSDFISEYSLCNIRYLDDYISEKADSEISCYYDEQRDYYYTHTYDCMDAFKNYGYNLKDFDDLDDAICKAGIAGWYDSNLNILCSEKSIIIKGLILEQMLYTLESGKNYNFVLFVKAFKNLKNDIFDDDLDSFYPDEILTYCLC